MDEEIIAESSSSTHAKKRKHSDAGEEIEIDLNAPEPPSKREQRKAKRVKSETKGSTPLIEEPNGGKHDMGDDPKPNHGARSQFGIWIGNLSFSTTKNDLMNFMTSDLEYPIVEENITRINMPSGSSKNGRTQNKGFAYIDLRDQPSLQHALELSEKLLGGRRVLIKDARSFEGRPEKSKVVAGNNTKAPSRRIFIGNLDFESTADSLEKHFIVCGKIKNTHLATFEDSGKCKGYAWVEFEDISSAEAAMRGWVEEGHRTAFGDVQRSTKRVWLHKINGRKLRLEYAEDPTTRYNKRFGKNLQDKGEARTGDLNGGKDQTTSNVERHNEDQEKIHHRQSRAPTRARKGYEGQAVQRLTGAIVESKGQRTVFD